MSHADKKKRLGAVSDFLELPLSDEAAWQIHKFLEAFTDMFEGRFYSQISRYTNDEWVAHKEKEALKESAKQDNDTEIPWDDDIPF